MFPYDFPILIQPAQSGFVVRVCAMDGRPLQERPIVCLTLDDVIAAVRDHLAPPARS